MKKDQNKKAYTFEGDDIKEIYIKEKKKVSFTSRLPIYFYTFFTAFALIFAKKMDDEIKLLNLNYDLLNEQLEENSKEFSDLCDNVEKDISGELKLLREDIKNDIKKFKIEEIVEEEKDIDLSIGDLFVPAENDLIYTSVDDLLSNEGSIPYYNDLHERYIAGIVFEYKGNTYFINENNIDYEDAIKLFNFNDTNVLGILSKNKENQYEGFYKVRK